MSPARRIGAETRRTGFSAAGLRIAGLAPFSSVDWPGRLVATVFLQGCPLDCFYCHNPALMDPRAGGTVPPEQLESLVHRRRRLLDGVVFSGGEPTLQHELGDAMRMVHEAGLEVGLHTAGPYPSRLRAVLPLVRWIGLDIKAPVGEYDWVAGRGPAGAKAWASLDLVLAESKARAGGLRPLDVEVRTTVDTSVMDAEWLDRLGEALADRGVEHYVVQRFRGEGVRPAPPARDGRVPAPADAVRAPVHLDERMRRRFMSVGLR